MNIKFVTVKRIVQYLNKKLINYGVYKKKYSLQININTQQLLLNSEFC